MNYAAVIREFHNRLSFHAKTPVPGLDSPLLEGLKIRESGNFRLDGESDLPHFVICDVQVADTRGKGAGTITGWLRVAARRGWFKKEGQDEAGNVEANGLTDWMLLIMDAIEMKPSDGAVDQLLIAHDVHGEVKLDNNQRPFELLSDPFEWECRMDELGEVALTMQMNLSFKLVTTKRATRRLNPKFKPPGAPA